MKRLSMATPFFFAIWLLHLVVFGSVPFAMEIRDVANAPPVKLLTKKNGHATMSNGILNVTLSTPSGMVTRISYNGIHNLLDVKKDPNKRGYWDINGKDRLIGTTYTVIVNTDDQIELSFSSMYNPSSKDGFPINVDKRFVILRGSSGFYTYTVLERKKGWPSMKIPEARVVFRLDSSMSYFMAMSDKRQREMPTEMDIKKAKTLDLKEAVQLVKPRNPLFEGEVDDKYFYSCDNKDNKVYGWVRLSDTNPVGFWMITPSNEFRTGGPFKQDLTSHVGPTILNMFISLHYTGANLTVDLKNGEPWKKVLGPVFVYLNYNKQAKLSPSILWKDAKTKMLEETGKWPYRFPASSDFVKAYQRGTVTGCLLVSDKYFKREFEAAAYAYVGLAKPGAVGSWQRENKGYQFWVKTDSKGKFVIKNVIPGTYSLYASVPRIIGDFKHKSDLIVTQGLTKKVGDIIYYPPRIGPTLWEIGIADRTAAEFHIPDPPSIFKVHQYGPRQDMYREYGLWRRYTELYPKNDLVYTIGVSTYSKDWFYAQVPRLADNNRTVSTTWKILFDLPSLKTNGDYTLQLALASARYAELEVRFNDERVVKPHFTTGQIGNDNAVARHGIHGLYWRYSIAVASKMLVRGRNTIYLKQKDGRNIFNNVMYDYIRFEAPV